MIEKCTEEELIDLRLASKKRWLIIIIALASILFLSIAVSITIGTVAIPLSDVITIIFHQGSARSTYETIIMDVRLPRVLLACLVGASLAIAGSVLQGVFRNPLASPYTIGVSSGAAFGAALTIVLNAMFVLVLPVSIIAFVFALIAMAMSYAIAQEKGKLNITILLLAGITVMTFFSALVSFLQYVAGDELTNIVFWIMGGLGESSWNDVNSIFPIFLLCAFILTLLSRDLNVIFMGDDHATNLGINVNRDRGIFILFSTLITAAAVSVSGVIGFVGLIVPHITRLLVGNDYRILLISSCFVGATLMIWMDVIARMMLQPSELPVGILTSLFGAPLFIILLKRKKKLKGW